MWRESICFLKLSTMKEIHNTDCGFQCEQQRKKKKNSIKKKSVSFCYWCCFSRVLLWKRKGAAIYLWGGRDVVGLMLLMSIVCFSFLIHNACFLHPFRYCLLRSKDLCCHWCQIILDILFEFFGWSEFLASFMAMKHLTS